jgi:hypothetical protein
MVASKNRGDLQKTLHQLAKFMLSKMSGLLPPRGELMAGSTLLN